MNSTRGVDVKKLRMGLLQKDVDRLGSRELYIWPAFLPVPDFSQSENGYDPG
jgi:hypothetical protein